MTVPQQNPRSPRPSEASRRMGRGGSPPAAALVAALLSLFPVPAARLSAAEDGGHAARAAEFEAARDVVADALRSAADAFPRGRIEFRTRHAYINRATPFRKVSVAEGELLWDGDRARWEARLAEDYRKNVTEPAIDNCTGDPAVDGDGSRAVVVILTGKELVVAKPEVPSAWVRPAADAPPQDVLRVRPRDLWHGDWHLGGGGHLWHSTLPRLVPMTPARAEAKKQVYAPPTATVDGSTVTLEAAPDPGVRGPVMWYELQAELDRVPRLTKHIARTSNDVFRKTYRADWHGWEAGGNSAFAPRAILKTDRLDLPDGYEERFDLKITAFDPDPEISAGTFTLKSVGLPPGTVVTRLDARGRLVGETVVAGKVTPPDRFKELAKDLAAGAFAGGEGDE